MSEPQFPLEVKKQFEDLRQRVLNNEPLEPEEYKIVIQVLRDGRENAANLAKSKAKKTKKHTLSEQKVSDLFNEV